MLQSEILYHHDSQISLDGHGLKKVGSKLISWFSIFLVFITSLCSSLVLVMLTDLNTKLTSLDYGERFELSENRSFTKSVPLSQWTNALGIKILQSGDFSVMPSVGAGVPLKSSNGSVTIQLGVQSTDSGFSIGYQSSGYYGVLGRNFTADTFNGQSVVFISENIDVGKVLYFSDFCI